MTARLCFGVFHPPYHLTGQNPMLALERDLQLVRHADMLGFDEFWFGEHHSGGVEFSGCPELMIAAAAERTKHIRLGTGVNSLPYHHPLILADRWLQLDYMTRGRAMFGVGPGALVSDARQMGIDPLEQRRMMEEALEAIIALLEDDAPVSRSTDWFKLRHARLNLRPFTHPLPDIRVASIISPAGPRAAGRFGLGLLSMGATSVAGFEALADAWSIASGRADAFGRTIHRGRWAVVGPMHIAETAAQAVDDVRFGLQRWLDYFTIAAGAHAPVSAAETTEDAVQQIRSSGMGVIGSPQDAIAQIQRLLDQSGGFGTYLLMLHEWADWEATLRSLDLFARYVIPHFRQQLARPREQFTWIQHRKDEIHRQYDSAQQKALHDHLTESEHRPGMLPETQSRARK